MSQPLPTAHASGSPVLSYTPVVLSVPGRPVDLSLRVSMPASGAELPIILFSHGHGPSNYVSSLYGYGPLVDFYAAHGFAVIQPTHLDSATLGLRTTDHPEAPLYWRSRAEDMHFILDHLDEIEAAVPQLRGRLDRNKVAVVGHSMGGHTASVLLGARFDDPNNGSTVDLVEPRITTGVILAGPGRGDALAPHAATDYPVFLTTDFSSMSAPALIVRGDADDLTHLTRSGPEWLEDPYKLAPAPKSQLVVFGGQHGLGGISAYDAAETTDENPARVALVQRLTCAYLRSAVTTDDVAWQEALDELADTPEPLGRVESR
jgi:pimeloyl-ACP methyl ester carboxylesterase